MGKHKGALLGSMFCAPKKQKAPFHFVSRRPCRVIFLLVCICEMEGFWDGICMKLHVPEAVMCRWREKIMASYQEAGRHYHNEHVMFLRHKLPHLQQGGRHQDAIAIALATVFQYVKFKPMSDVTEENCDLFREFAEEAGLSAEGLLVAKVLCLLGAQHHEHVDISEEDVNFFRDLDLAVLGSSADEYEEYCQRLRKEFPEMEEQVYCKMRLKVIQSLLQVPCIFSSDAFSQSESTARRNLEKEVSQLLSLVK